MTATTLDIDLTDGTFYADGGARGRRGARERRFAETPGREINHVARIGDSGIW